MTLLPTLSSPRRALQARPPVALQAGVAELTLVTRLRARTRRDLASDALERAAQIIQVTAKHWFGPAPTWPMGV